VTTLLIDGDEYLYVACAAAERDVRWDKDNHVLSCNAEEAWDTFCASIERLKGNLGGSRAYLAFGGEGNFRKDLDPTYKAHRKDARKPLCLPRLYERALNEELLWQAKAIDGIEGDDLLGIWSTSGRFGDTVIVSSDKDMKTLPTTIYRDGIVINNTETEANYFWLYQTLTGDTADGYKGCPGIGEVKAAKLLNEFCVSHSTYDHQFIFEAAWEAVIRTFEAAGLGYEDALLQARLARILRAEDWDSEAKEVILWEPK
jgi:DNA polymerase-1